jgi:hypothetical protein
MELLLIAPLGPSFSAGAIAGERERQTFDLVMTTPIRARDFVLGKLLSSLSYVLLLVFVALPVQVLAVLFGGLTATEVALGFWTLIVAAVFYASTSLFFSAVMRSTTTAAIFSYLTVAMSLVGAVVVLFILGAVSDGFGPLGLAFGQTGPQGPPSSGDVWFWLLMLSLSPLTAGGATALALNLGEGTFWFRLGEQLGIPGYPNGYFVVSPWLLYSALYLGLSALLTMLAIRSVRPTSARNPGNPARRPALAEQAAEA